MDPAVVVSFFTIILLELGFPLLVAWFLVRRYHISWTLFLYGALFFILVQIVHTPLVLFTQAPLSEALYAAIPSRTLALAVFAIILGLLAGLFEEIGRYLVFSRFFPSRNIATSREHGLLFGAGWGGVESMMIAGLLALTLVAYLFSASPVLASLTPLDPLVSLLERLMVFPLQIAFTLLVLLSVALGRPLLLGLAILWHTEVDALAVFLGVTSGIAVTEAMVAVNAALALIYIWYQRPERHGLGGSSPAD